MGVSKVELHPVHPRRTRNPTPCLDTTVFFPTRRHLRQLRPWSTGSKRHPTVLYVQFTPMIGCTRGSTWCASTASPFLTIFVSPGFRPIALVRNKYEGQKNLEALTWNVEGLESREVRLFHIADLLRRQGLVRNLFIIELQVRLW